MNAATDTAPVTPANCNRASAGYTWDTLMAMLACVTIGAGRFYPYSGPNSSATIIAHRDNHLPVHEAALLAAAARFRSLGLKVRATKRGGRVDFLTVYGPKSGGVAGRYSA